MTEIKTMDEPERARESGPGASGRTPFQWRRLWPIALLAAGLVAAKAFGLDAYLSFEQLQQNRAALLDWVERWGALAVIVYALVYIAVVAFSLPGGAVMTIAGGFLFGQAPGAAYVVVAATIGATLVFLAAKTSLGDQLAGKAGPWLARMRAGFNENALSYMLFLRLVPVVPFFVANLAPAFLGVRLRTYVIATFVGIIPGTFVYASFGAGLGAIFDRGESFSVSAVLTPEILTGLVGLGVIALIPAAYKKIKGKRRLGP
ncbi:MAG: TVP38/TMEM64 family protein [Marivibrio sp.]|uniref:TVP38/TMEM64 family protein n=1 Tax=Marivibrio sp. TaxID=2039719 RepID=UPI0032F02528